MTVKIPYYIARERSGRRLGYWQPTPRMRAAGFRLIPCGEDGPEAWSIAHSWNERWQLYRKGFLPDKSLAQTFSSNAIGYVYFMKVGDRIKIGFSINPQSRVASLSTGLSQPFDMLMAVRGTPSDERKLHRRLASYRQKGEWFVAAPAVMRLAMRSLIFGRAMHSDAESASEQIGHAPLTP